MPRFRGRVKRRLLHWRKGSGRASSSCGRGAPEAGWYWRRRGGGVPTVAVAVSLRGRPGRRTAAGGGGVAYGVVVGVGAMAMAALTRGRHCVRLRDPGGRPLGLVPLMLKVGGGEPGALGGGGFGGRMVAEIMISYICGRRCRSPPPLLRGGSKARASLIPRAILLLSLARYVMSSGWK
jgi:hypothetical protein